MKTKLLILVSVLLAGCTFDRKDDFDVDYAIEFQPAMYMHSAPSDTEAYPEGQEFGVSAWVLPEDCRWEEDCADAEEYMSSSCLSCDGNGRWMSQGQEVWPSKDERLTFLAYSPYRESCRCDRSEGVVWDVNVLENQTDLLYTEPVGDMSKLECGGVVTLPFRHALCLVDFRVKHRVEPGHKIIVKKITVDRVCNQGTFRSLAEPMWEIDESMAPLEIYEGSYEVGELPEYLGREWLLIPQDLDTQVTVEYEYEHVHGGGLKMNLSTVSLKTALEAGMKYTFTLSIGIDDVKFLTELIEHRMD